jgi:hypothetical protein
MFHILLLSSMVQASLLVVLAARSCKQSMYWPVQYLPEEPAVLVCAASSMCPIRPCVPTSWSSDLAVSFCVSRCC